MTAEEISRLEFKRKFILQNISDVKKEWYKFDDYREKLRLLFMTVWFGTTAIYLKENKITWTLSALLAIITIVFFILESYYLKASQIRLVRISIMEDWIMQASDEDILNLNGPLSNVAPPLDKVSRDELPRLAFWQGRVNILYITFLLLSGLIKILFTCFTA